MQLTLQQQFLRQPHVVSCKQQLIAVTGRTAKADATEKYCLLQPQFLSCTLLQSHAISNWKTPTGTGWEFNNCSHKDHLN